MAREKILHHVGRLGALIHGQHVVGGVVVRQNATGFVGHTSVATELIHFLNHDISFCKRVFKSIGHQLTVKALVVA